jgi:lysophospholipase L1-like esterase
MVGGSRRHSASALVVVATAFVALIALIAASAPAAPAGAATSPGSPAEIRSVVILGDSVAAGEGTLDGYTYEDRPLLSSWSKTKPPRAYDSARRACHRSPRAYGEIVARELGATATTFACTGATFGRGVALDAAYDRAAPDLVLVTAGANSVAFERAFAYCVLASRGFSDAEAARIAAAPTIPEALSSAVSTAVARLGGPSTAATSGCTASNPGAYLQRTVLDRIDDVTTDAAALAREIRDRGREAGRVPTVVFTTYFDPLPDEAASLARCPDGAGLGAAQLEYMHQLLGDLNGALTDALADVPGTRVADPGPAFDGHRWCDAHPWVYGTSILVTDSSSSAPFHPTPAGQRAIARAVLDRLRHGERGASGPV